MGGVVAVREVDHHLDKPQPQRVAVAPRPHPWPVPTAAKIPKGQGSVSSRRE